MNHPRVVLDATLSGPSAARADELLADGVIHADVTMDIDELEGGAGRQWFDTGELSISPVLRTGPDPRSTLRRGLHVGELAGVWFDSFADPESVADAAAVARQEGLPRCVSMVDTSGEGLTPALLEVIDPARIADGDAVLADCVVVDERVTALGDLAAEIRDRGLPVAVGDPAMIRVLGDAGLRLTFDGAEIDFEQAALDPGEIYSARERTAAAAFVRPDRADELARLVRSSWSHEPARLVHMAERARWQDAKDKGAYLPAEFDADGFIHLSALAQVLTPANRFYRGRRDLVALVIDAHSLAPALVWEPGTGTTEFFPHLYGALDPGFVVAEIPMMVEGDGTFLLPPGLARAVRGT